MTSIFTGSAVSMPAEAVQLVNTYDEEHLLAELKSAREHTWDRQRGYSEAGVAGKTDVDWRCLAIRSLGGDGDRTDPGGPGPEEFADTEWLDGMPYVREILKSIPAPLHAVRFMALGPDTIGKDHHDAKMGPKWGMVRLHIPVLTNPDAVLHLDSVQHRWLPGEFWFGDFSRVHRVQNTGAEHRVHLVIDALATRSLASIFPEHWQEYWNSDSVLHNRSEVPQTAEDRSRNHCSFDAPAAFFLWEKSSTLATDDGQVRVTSGSAGTGLQLQQPTRGPINLVHVGENEYRLAGWSEERTIQFLLDEPSPQVILRLREGGSVQQIHLPAH
ncbi:aspartyl/asparaginyl beta-hydroxylase domain-containing protein [Streptomyces sp. NPDC055663]